MKQRRFIRKLQKSARRVLVVFLAIIFTLTVNIIVSESGRGRPRAAHRGGQGSIRHQGEAREHTQERERRKSNRRHANKDRRNDPESPYPRLHDETDTPGHEVILIVSLL